MQIKILRVFLYGDPIGRIFSYGDLIRFVADLGIGVAREDGSAWPIMSLSMLASNPDAQAALWANVKSPLFNAQGGRLPTFFQNLLPEGVLRKHIAALRGCAENDHFDLLAACGKHLPGAVTVGFEDVTDKQLQRLVTQDNDALEVSVVAMPIPDAISVSGMQPKLALVKVGTRYVHRTKNGQGTRIIAKLPVVGQPFMPLLEHMALELARAAGVTTCHTSLARLSDIDSLQGYTLPQETEFLCVHRFDRDGAEHLHFEDFAQILNVDPKDKYTLSYAAIAQVLMTQPSMGEPAVHELVRRLVVHELLGNPDGHLKNFGVLYVRDLQGCKPTFAPAFDVVPYAISQGIDGHALPLVPKPKTSSHGTNKRAVQLFTPASIREFCTLVRIQDFSVRQTIKACCALAEQHWPALIEASGLPDVWRAKLMARLTGHPLLKPSRKVIAVGV